MFGKKTSTPAVTLDLRERVPVFRVGRGYESADGHVPRGSFLSELEFLRIRNGRAMLAAGYLHQESMLRGEFYATRAAHPISADMRAAGTDEFSREVERVRKAHPGCPPADAAVAVYKADETKWSRFHPWSADDLVANNGRCPVCGRDLVGGADVKSGEVAVTSWTPAIGSVALPHEVRDCSASATVAPGVSRHALNAALAEVDDLTKRATGSAEARKLLAEARKALDACADLRPDERQGFFAEGTGLAKRARGIVRELEEAARQESLKAERARAASREVQQREEEARRREAAGADTVARVIGRPERTSLEQAPRG